MKDMSLDIIEERNLRRIIETKAKMPELYEVLMSIEPPSHPDPINPDWLDEPDTGEEEEERY